MAVKERTLGEFYSRIPTSLRDFERTETKLVKRADNSFVKFCKNIYSSFPALGKGGKFDEEIKKAIEFLDWDLNGEQFTAAFNFVLYISILLSAFIGVVIYISPIYSIIVGIVGDFYFLAPVVVFGVPLIISYFLLMWFRNYPLRCAENEQVKSLSYVPEIVGYMSMSIKLVPNLEKAVEFAAEHGRGKIAEDFKKLLWNVQIGVYSTLSEGLDVLAYRWGLFSEEFKKALIRMRASILEDSDAKRYVVLDKTIDEILTSIKDKLEKFARDLSQPIVILFYVGIILPLILIIILPIGSAFSGLPFANPIVLFLLYNISIPLVTFYFANKILEKKPPVYEPPIIEDDYPGLPKKGIVYVGGMQLNILVIVIIVLILGILISFYISAEGFPPKSIIGEGVPQLIPFDKNKSFVLARDGKDLNYFNKGGALYRAYIAEGLSEEQAMVKVKLEEKTYFMSINNDIAPYNLIFGLIITFSLAISFYLYFKTVYKRKAQLEIMQMEHEFKDAIYILASRLGENRPIEESLKYSIDFLPKSKIAQRLFSKILDNISLMYMSLEDAIFDPTYGAIKDIPSNVIKMSMKLMVDSVKLGVDVAARTMANLAIQLSNIEKVSTMLKLMLGEMVMSMRTMSLFVGPIILGITTSLQRVVVITIASISSSEILSSLRSINDLSSVSGMPSIASSFTALDIKSFIRPEALSEIAEPTIFIIIVALYTIELVFILNYFTTKLEEDNDLLVWYNLSIYLPISAIIFILSVLASNFLVSIFMGGL